ncbi:MAG: uracil-DNA glycosylase family protein [Ktedonobacteraceae bacterium]
MGLLHEITRCPNIQMYFSSPQCNNPCARIISTQHASSIDMFQVPEPWSGNLEHAPILFLSSNPSINGVEEIPLWSWPNEWIEDFYVNRYEGGRKQWIKDGKYNLLLDGSRQIVRFWVEVRQRAKELLERDIRHGVDYALTEVVHCKSQGEEGVREALNECSRRYLRWVIESCGAKVIVTLGKTVKEAVKLECGIPTSVDVFGPTLIGTCQRYIVFLPHPNARGYRSFEKCIDHAELQELRDFLRS